MNFHRRTASIPNGAAVLSALTPFRHSFALVRTTTSTTSGIAQTDILKSALIANGAIVVLLVLYYLMSERVLERNITAALRTACVPLTVVFCAFVVFTAAHS